MREERRGLLFYYAHLDKQLCRPGQLVKAGDTLGLIGFTGNAHSSEPHLHYGVYTDRFIDPYPYVYDLKHKPAFAETDVRRLGYWARASDNTLLHEAPSQLSVVHRDIPVHTMFHVTGYERHWVKVRLARGDTGYIPRHHTEPAVRPLYGVTLNKRSYLHFTLDESNPSAIDTLFRGDALLVFGRIDKSLHVKTFSGAVGWVDEMHSSVVSTSVQYQ